MYQAIEALDKEQHKDLRYSGQNNYAFARELTNTPLVADEIPQVANSYPILFATEQPQPIAILGLRNENVYLNENSEWNTNYIPAFVRRYPFILANNEKQFFLAIDRQAPHFSKTEGETLITEEGNLAQVGSNALNFLRIYQEATIKTQKLFQLLEDADVLVEKNLSIQDVNTTRMIAGFRIIDAQKVDALPDETLALWVRNGLIHLIHDHWNSLRHLNTVAIASNRPKTTN